MAQARAAEEQARSSQAALQRECENVSKLSQEAGRLREQLAETSNKAAAAEKEATSARRAAQNAHIQIELAEKKHRKMSARRMTGSL